MTAAHDNRSEALKEAAVLRSLAEAVAFPVVAGHKSHRQLNELERDDWKKIVDVIVWMPQTTAASVSMFSSLGQSKEVQAKNLARTWQAMARTQKIGYAKWPLIGFVPIPGFWMLFFRLLIQLAILYIESRSQQGQDSER
jgi:hypothetical protein